MDNGCELLLEYRQCTEGLKFASCNLPGSVLFWNDMELYICQLLLPSVKEYTKCLTTVHRSDCPAELVHLFQSVESVFHLYGDEISERCCKVLDGELVGHRRLSLFHLPHLKIFNHFHAEQKSEMNAEIRDTQMFLRYRRIVRLRSTFLHVI